MRTILNKSLLLLLPIIFSSSIVCQPVNPQPGENIWHLTAAIGTEVDNLATCCVGTFTALASCCHTITSKIDELELCNAVPLTIPSVGITIETAGVYCLTTNQTLGASNNICIDANDVVLDLNGHTITGGGSGSSTILIGSTPSSTINTVTIKNGFIDSSNGNAVGTNSGNTFSGITIEDITIHNSPTGVLLQGSTSMNNSIIRNVLTDVCVNGFKFSNAKNCLVENCNANGIFLTTPASGFSEVSACNNITFRNCTCSFFGNSGTDGGFNFSTSTNLVFDSCNAFNNGNDGFKFNQSTLTNCVADGNFSSGFNSLNPDNILMNCKAINTFAVGFTGGGTFENCIASDNIFSGFFMTDKAQLTDCQSTDNKTAPNGKGFYISADNVNLTRCISSNNLSDGFFMGSNSHCEFLECQALNNKGNGFNLSPASATTVASCFANNNTGYGFTVNTVASLFNNSAINNTGSGTGDYNPDTGGTATTTPGTINAASSFVYRINGNNTTNGPTPVVAANVRTAGVGAP